MTSNKDVQSSYRIGVDVGGTFTDLVVVHQDGHADAFKVPTVPDDPSKGVLAAVHSAAEGLGISVTGLLANCAAFVHGTTIATNTVLERKGARVGMLTTAGFRDSVAIRRGLRDNPWDHRTPFAEPLAPRHLRLGVGGRIDANGREVEPLCRDDISKAIEVFAKHGVESIAVCFLNSYVNGQHERETLDALRQLECDLPVSLSSSLSSTMGEYERGSTTIIDAFIRARVVRYLKELSTRLKELGLRPEVLVVQSNGGVVSLERISRAPVSICLSGPAAGVGAMRYFGRLSGVDDLITMEIGGTSCDVTMMQSGATELVDLYRLGGFHVGQPSVEIHTVGAGGGTIARIDDGGMLVCGPQGAGADPGPACYGIGGTQATTTDALVVLGRMRAGRIGDGSISIDPELARKAIMSTIAEPLGISVEQAAVGIISLLEQNLLHAVEEISVKRGFNPSKFTLVAAGGAGPMHGVDVARALGCRRVFVPRDAGVFCALGMLDSDLRLDFTRVMETALTVDGLIGAARQTGMLIEDAKKELTEEAESISDIQFESVLDLTYKGQMRALGIPWNPGKDDVDAVKARFETQHQQSYGHIKPITPIRLVATKIVASIPAVHLEPPSETPNETRPEPDSTRRVFLDNQNSWQELPVFQASQLGAGNRFKGPLIIEGETTTTFVGLGDELSVDSAGNYTIDLR